MSFYTFAKTLAAIGLRVGYHMRFHDTHNIPADRGVILAGNHQSYLDPVLMGIGCKKKITFMAKSELFDKPVLGTVLRWLGAFPVSRGNGDTSALDHAAEVVKSGGIFGIFPEGTRSKTGKLGRVKSGAVVISAQTGGDIIPVGIRFGGKKLWRRKIDIYYGVPILNRDLHIENNDRHELKAAVQLLAGSIAALLGDETA